MAETTFVPFIFVLIASPQNNWACDQKSQNVAAVGGGGGEVGQVGKGHAIKGLDLPAKEFGLDPEKQGNRQSRLSSCLLPN